MVKVSAPGSEPRRVAGSIPDSTNFLTNKAMDKLLRSGVPVHQAVKLVPAIAAGGETL